MEHENDYNRYGSKGAANTGLGLGIAGTALGLMAGGLNGTGLFGNNGAKCSEDHYINRYELSLQNEIEAKNSRIALLESNIYVDSKIADIYEKLNTKIGGIEAQICQQNVYNATNTAAISCINNQIATLMSLTKTVVPNSNICPGWGDVTVSVTPTTTAGA
jgi:hypothetical protein